MWVFAGGIYCGRGEGRFNGTPDYEDTDKAQVGRRLQDRPGQNWDKKMNEMKHYGIVVTKNWKANVFLYGTEYIV